MALHKTIEQLDDEMGLDEFLRWEHYEALYDLPDAYLVAGQLGALVNNIMGGKAIPADFARYYRVERERKPGAPGATNHAAVAASKAFARSVVKGRR